MIPTDDLFIQLFCYKRDYNPLFDPTVCNNSDQFTRFQMLEIKNELENKNLKIR